MRSLLILVALAGCYETANTSSLDVLAKRDSGAVLTEPPLQAARDVAAAMLHQGYTLEDQGKAGDGIQLRLVKPGVAYARDTWSGVYELVGSNMYVTVLPAGAGSTVSFVGKPTLEGEENADVPDVVKEDVMNGEAEAHAIHSALAELQLKGVIAGKLPSDAPVYVEPDRAPDPDCMAERKAILKQADATKDLDERAKLVLSAKECPALIQPVGS
ncbi:MAG: hypothetical protein QM831_43260 [Kofleriaceae bacterium]